MSVQEAVEELERYEGRKVWLRCGRCGRRITTLEPHGAVPAVLPPAAHVGTRALLATAAQGPERRWTFVCPGRRCGARYTVTVARLVARFLTAARANRPELEL